MIHCALVFLALSAVVWLAGQSDNPLRKMNARVRPFNLIGNVWYVGTAGISSFLIATDEGNILIDTGYESTIPLVAENVHGLGFRMRLVRFLLSSHAHEDHVGGHAFVKERWSPQIVASEADAAVISTGANGQWKPAKVDRIIRDGESVWLGGTRLTAHLTPGHTKGCTTWTAVVEEGGKNYHVVFLGGAGVNPEVRLVGNTEYPEIAADYARTFKVLKSLPCDVLLAQHPEIFALEDKLKLRSPGGAAGRNPFIDPPGCRATIERSEKADLEKLRTDT